MNNTVTDINNIIPGQKVTPIIIDNLPENAPELQLSRLLQEYRHLREERLKDVSKTAQAAAMLVITSLQKRLLSSIEAFARTLKVHRTAIERSHESRERNKNNTNYQSPITLLLESAGADDDRAELPEAEIEAEEDAQMSAASREDGLQATPRELEILRQMGEIADQVRYQPDPRIIKLIEWIKVNLCPDLGENNAAWLNKRVIIFTEYTDTKRYLQQQLEAAIAHSHLADNRIDVFHGGIGDDRREEIKQAFNSDPSRHPLRILIATDAAREGVNLQNHCADLFHFDVPWNPSRMEQRNGRIDRKLQ
ncbi:helicase-like protein [Sphaerospermopsis reniformis]|uniref:Helicase-like protein n=1 Tax=Sphaerospermopsis reniformis TaxID=531300 RepID=A0A480A8Q5_9CYAN|nr:helicase-related protein [Sphaerospermopsis reniformis]GCL40113.1 helicase-like protein [Sphaerospermopsis reniformis]